MTAREPSPPRAAVPEYVPPTVTAAPALPPPAAAKPVRRIAPVAMTEAQVVAFVEEVNQQQVDAAAVRLLAEQEAERKEGPVAKQKGRRGVPVPEHEEVNWWIQKQVIPERVSEQLGEITTDYLVLIESNGGWVCADELDDEGFPIITAERVGAWFAHKRQNWPAFRDYLINSAYGTLIHKEGTDFEYVSIDRETVARFVFEDVRVDNMVVSRRWEEELGEFTEMQDRITGLNFQGVFETNGYLNSNEMIRMCKFNFPTTLEDSLKRDWPVELIHLTLVRWIFTEILLEFAAYREKFDLYVKQRAAMNKRTAHRKPTDKQVVLGDAEVAKVVRRSRLAMEENREEKRLRAEKEAANPKKQGGRKKRGAMRDFIVDDEVPEDPVGPPTPVTLAAAVLGPGSSSSGSSSYGSTSSGKRVTFYPGDKRPRSAGGTSSSGSAAEVSSSSGSSNIHLTASLEPASPGIPAFPDLGGVAPATTFPPITTGTVAPFTVDDLVAKFLASASPEGPRPGAPLTADDLVAQFLDSASPEGPGPVAPVTPVMRRTSPPVAKAEHSPPAPSTPPPPRATPPPPRSNRATLTFPPPPTAATAEMLRPTISGAVVNGDIHKARLEDMVMEMQFIYHRINELHGTFGRIPPFPMVEFRGYMLDRFNMLLQRVLKVGRGRLEDAFLEGINAWFKTTLVESVYTAPGGTPSSASTSTSTPSSVSPPPTVQRSPSISEPPTEPDGSRREEIIIESSPEAPSPPPPPQLPIVGPRLPFSMITVNSGTRGREWHRYLVPSRHNPSRLVKLQPFDPSTNRMDSDTRAANAHRIIQARSASRMAHEALFLLSKKIITGKQEKWSTLQDRRPSDSGNPAFQLRDSLDRGLGVFAVDSIPYATVVCEVRGERVGPIRQAWLRERDGGHEWGYYQAYLFTRSGASAIDTNPLRRAQLEQEGRLPPDDPPWGLAGHINHSALAPNLAMFRINRKYGDREYQAIYMVSTTSIPAGQELLYDYGHSPWEAGSHSWCQACAPDWMFT